MRACEMREIRPERTDLWAKHPAARRILLDPAGKAMDTAAFVALVSRAEMEGRDLVFVVGGADGLPRGLAGTRGRAAFAFAHDFSARIGARHAGRADLPGVRHVAGASLPALR